MSAEDRRVFCGGEALGVGEVVDIRWSPTHDIECADVVIPPPRTTEPQSGSVSSNLGGMGVDDEWARAVFRFLDERKPSRQQLFDLLIRIEPVLEPDPFGRRPPAGWRAKLVWIWQCAVYPWRRELGLLQMIPEERWQLQGVTLWSTGSSGTS